MSITIECGGDYIGEILRTWGLLDAGREVWIIPAGAGVDAAAVEAKARGGAVVIAVMPGEDVAQFAGLTLSGQRAMPSHLRITGFAPYGLEGELLPIVGAANTNATGEQTPEPVAWLCHRDNFAAECPGIVEMPLGAGRLVVIAFDLPRCVWILRQGDPAREGHIPAGDGCERPSHLACDVDAGDAAWCPFADLLARLLVDLAARGAGHPVPLLHHLPGAAPALLLYSGDEDVAPVADTDEQMAMLQSRGARMDLYVIPDATASTAADFARYARHHDLGPHPNLRPCDGKPLAEKLARLEAQINAFKALTGIEPLALRNHCTAWAGYMQHVEVLQRCGLRMEASYFSSDYMRGRRYAPYNAFGGAMPMRFARGDGSLINVYQQHTPFADDVLFGTRSEYCYRFTAAGFAPIAERACREAATRFHTPLGVCIHPSNRPKISRAGDAAILDAAARHNMPIWSFTQWCRFWIERERCTISDVRWANGTLSLTATNPTARDDLSVSLPAAGLQAVRVDGKAATSSGLVALGGGAQRIEADYQE